MSEQDVTIGWIGCGRMGTAMVRRLLEAGTGVTVTNRTRAKAEALMDSGAKVVDSPRALSDFDVVFVMVSADVDVLEVVTGKEGVLSNASVAPRIVVDCSTISAEASAKVRVACSARGVGFLAAPVSGNPKVVAAGQLTLAVSGEREDFESALPYLAQIGHRVTYVGSDEVARLVKICHNMFLGTMAQSLAEIVVLAESNGIKRSALLDFLNNSILGSPFTRYKTPAFVNLDFTPTFTTRLLRKDFDIGMAAAKAKGVAMPVSALSSEMVASAIGAGLGDRDFAALLVEQARRAGLDMSPEQVTVDDGLNGQKQ